MGVSSGLMQRKNQGVNDMKCIKWMLIGVLACLVVGTLWWCGGKYGRCMWLGDVIVAGVAVSMTVLTGGIWWALTRIANELKRVANRLEQGAGHQECQKGEEKFK